MKFSKKNQKYIREKAQILPGVVWKKLNVLNICSKMDFQSRKNPDKVLHINTCNHNNNCPVCDEAFFLPLVNDTSAVVSYSNQRAKKLLKLHQAAGFRMYFRLKGKQQRTHVSLIEEVQDLVIYALRNAVQMKQLLQKFDEVQNCCNQRPALKSQAQRMQNSILQSAWLRELLAMHINLRETIENTGGIAPAFAEAYNLRFNDRIPSISLELFNSIKLDIDLTCPICLETVFDPVCLTCGHILCKMCACSAASVSIVDGLKSAQPREKCPLCRQAGVYGGVVRLTELSMLLSRSFPEYWEKRLGMERVDRVKQTKEYWESQCRAFMGF